MPRWNCETYKRKFQGTSKIEPKPITKLLTKRRQLNWHPKENDKQPFGAEKRGNKLDHFIWSCTRAYPVKHAFSLGDGKPLPNELTTAEAKAMLKKVADFGVDNLFISGAGWTGEPLMREDFIEIIR